MNNKHSCGLEMLNDLNMDVRGLSLFIDMWCYNFFSQELEKITILLSDQEKIATPPPYSQLIVNSQFATKLHFRVHIST